MAVALSVMSCPAVRQKFCVSKYDLLVLTFISPFSVLFILKVYHATPTYRNPRVCVSCVSEKMNTGPARRSANNPPPFRQRVAWGYGLAVNVHNHFVGRGLAGRSVDFWEVLEQLGIIGGGLAALI